MRVEMVVGQRVEAGRECSQVLRAWVRGFWREEGEGDCRLGDGGDGCHVARLIAAACCSRPVCFRTEVLTPRSSVRTPFGWIVVGTKYLPA